MIKVLVCAKSTAELNRLESAVRSARTLELVGSSLGRAGLRQHLAETQIDVLLECPYFDGAEELRFAHDSETVAKVLLVPAPEFGATFTAIQEADSMIRGVLPLWASAREIQIAIEAAANGLLVIHPDVTEHASRTSDPPGRAATAFPEQQLSPREIEILNLLALGLGNKEIAKRLKISDHTVKFHVTSIFNKLSVSSRTAAVAVGIRRGVIIL